MNIRMYKMTSGEYIMGDVQPGQGVTLKNPALYQLIPTDQGQVIMITEILLFSEETSISFENEHVVFSYKPNGKIVEAYEQQMSDIIKVKSPALVVSS